MNPLFSLKTCEWGSSSTWFQSSHLFWADTQTGSSGCLNLWWAGSSLIAGFFIPNRQGAVQRILGGRLYLSIPWQARSWVARLSTRSVRSRGGRGVGKRKWRSALMIFFLSWFLLATLSRSLGEGRRGLRSSVVRGWGSLIPGSHHCQPLGDGSGKQALSCWLQLPSRRGGRAQSRLVLFLSTFFSSDQPSIVSFN